MLISQRCLESNIVLCVVSRCCRCLVWCLLLVIYRRCLIAVASLDIRLFDLWMCPQTCLWPSAIPILSSSKYFRLAAVGGTLIEFGIFYRNSHSVNYYFVPPPAAQSHTRGQLAVGVGISVWSSISSSSSSCFANICSNLQRGDR